MEKKKEEMGSGNGKRKWETRNGGNQYLLASDKPLGIKHSIRWVEGDLVLCCVTNKSFVIRECYIGGRCSVSLIVCLEK